jgi:hypothetical protein
MWDYSLERLASRPARVGDKLITARFKNSFTGGFCSIGEADVAVCLSPGTELAFEQEIEAVSRFWCRPKKLAYKVARFRQVNLGQRMMHHDALELPGGEIVLLTTLREGQSAAVLQLPAGREDHETAQQLRDAAPATLEE